MIVTALLTALLTAQTVPLDPADRLYGRVTTTEGVSHEGFLRWDRNEASPLDFLDGRKVVPIEYLQEAASLDPEVAARQQAERTIVAFGMRITWDEDDESDPFATVSAVRMGRIRTLERLDRRTVGLTLRDGSRVDLMAGSTDLGPSMRGLEVERGGARITLDWDEVERVDLFDAPPPGAHPEASRLYGTLTTWNDAEYTGVVTWDLDESVTTDVLDGRSGSDDHEIPFAEIREIAWESDRSAMVTLVTGERIELRGTNDVNRQNRGVEVAGVFGRATVGWGDFQRVRFVDVAEGSLSDFEPGAALYGTVYALDGRVIEGEVRWDNDEEFGWELLDGWRGDADVDIEFGSIASIERLDDEGVVVTTRDGAQWTLEGQGDVGSENNGIFVRPEGRARRLVRWADLQRVEFRR